MTGGILSSEIVLNQEHVCCIWELYIPVYMPKPDHRGVEMFPENHAPGDDDVILMVLPQTGWLETGHDCSTKEGDLFGLFI